jgi:DNA-binding transcriptional MerR regulator/methylmalonyl-CoA mutase cobalamin-binding subunit
MKDDAALALANDLPQVLLPINAVERETGISKELLRMWERRYGFPAPNRDAQGDRVYPPEQVAKLRVIRRLLDGGFRPGKIINLTVSALEQLVNSHQPAPAAATQSPPKLEQELLEVLKSRDPYAVSQYLNHQVTRMGLEAFVMDLMQHANAFVGDAWMRGVIEIYEEHLYTEQVQSIVRHSMSNLRPSTSKPRVMLTTAPDEQHTLGILMVEALLRVDEVDAISFGAQMPIREIHNAVNRHQIDVVLLSFSASYPSNRAIEFLEELRFRLPLSVDIWCGGGGMRNSRREVEDVTIIESLGSVRSSVLQWRRAHGMLRDQ